MKMKSIKIPEEYNYSEAFLTLGCNLKCSYCINDNNLLQRSRDEMTAEQWIKGINRIDFGKIPLTLGGGEPTLYGGFYEILNGLKPKIKIDLLTNLQFDVDEFIKNTEPKRFTQSNIPAYRAIRVSYHVGQMDPENLVDKVEKLQDNGFSVGIFGLDHPEFINENMRIMELAVNKKIFFFPKNFLGIWNGKLYGTYKYPEALSGNKKKVQCRIKEILIAPEGSIYRCHRDLYLKENPVSHLLDEDLDIKYVFRPCPNYGECNPCDVKLKTNFYLDRVDCQTEIKEP